MGKSLKKFITLLFIITLFVGCSKGNIENVNKNLEKKTIYTSFYPIADVAKKIAGDKMNVKNLIPTGQGVHHWEPTAKDMSNLYKGSVLLVNGLNLEGWTEKFESALKDLIIVEVSKGVNLLKTENHEHHEKEKDANGNEVVKPMTEEQEKHHSHGEHDPHIWLSLRNMKIISENIYNEIVKMDEENKEYYKSNLLDFQKKLDELDKEFTEKFKNAKLNSVITSHEAFAYLFNDYGLKQIAIEGINSDSEPNMERMKKVINIAKKEGIRYVFFEELSDDKIEQTIAKEIGGKVGMLYTIEGQTEDQEKENKDYLQMMRENLEALVEATR